MAEQTVTLGGKKFVIVEETRFRRLQRQAEGLAAQERGDVAESKRRLARHKRIPATKLKQELGL